MRKGTYPPLHPCFSRSNPPPNLSQPGPPQKNPKTGRRKSPQLSAKCEKPELRCGRPGRCLRDTPAAYIMRKLPFSVFIKCPTDRFGQSRAAQLVALNGEIARGRGGSNSGQPGEPPPAPTRTPSLWSPHSAAQEKIRLSAKPSNSVEVDERGAP